MKKLTQFESDLIGDLAQDTHGVWEVFGFVGLHYPQATDEDVFARGYALLERWVDRGWIKLATEPICPTNVSSIHKVLEMIDRQGVRAIRYWHNAPSIDLTKKATEDVPWLIKDQLTRK